jgi:uncharacterized protein (DUF1499 family)
MAASKGRGLSDNLGFTAGALLLGGPLVAHFRVVPAIVGFLLFALGGLLGLVLTLIALVRLARGGGFGAGRGVALVAAGVFVLAALRGRGAPRINDFTTDLADPPAFRHAKSLGPNAGRDLSYPAAFADVQRTCCAELQPGHVKRKASEAFPAAKRVAEQMSGWEITEADPASGTIEAIAVTPLFRFQDDIVIRLRDEAGGCRIDMRSKSRDGQGDIGANATRIRTYIAAVEAAG